MLCYRRESVFWNGAVCDGRSKMGNQYFLNTFYVASIDVAEIKTENSYLLEYTSSGYFFLLYYFFSHLPAAVIDACELRI